jgi:amino acid permease
MCRLVFLYLITSRSCSPAFGMAAAGGTGPVLATLILFLFGALSWYSLVSFARAAEAVLVDAPHAAGESLSAVWERIVPHGEATKYIPDLGCVLLTVGCLLFYSAFIGDLFGSLVSGLTFLPPILRKRWSVLLVLHAIPILPLCLIKDLSALQYSSMTGLVGILYTIFFVGKRLLDGSYAAGGRFFDLMPAKFQPAPQIGFSGAASSSSFLGYVMDLPPFHFTSQGLLTLMNMCCVACTLLDVCCDIEFLVRCFTILTPRVGEILSALFFFFIDACHYNAVKYYMELKLRTVPSLMNVMAAGIGGTGLVFGCMMILGYATFGRHAQTLLLNNYHPSQDLMATVARTFTGIAIISGYALMFAGFKAALFSLLKLDQPNVPHRSEKQNTLSALFVAAIATAACFVTEHELATVIGIVGSVFGSVVIYIFPAIVNNCLLKMKDKNGNAIAKPFFKGEALFNKIMVLFGALFAVLGTWISLTGAESH